MSSLINEQKKIKMLSLLMAFVLFILLLLSWLIYTVNLFNSDNQELLDSNVLMVDQRINVAGQLANDFLGLLDAPCSLAVQETLQNSQLEHLFIYSINFIKHNKLTCSSILAPPDATVEFSSNEHLTGSLYLVKYKTPYNSVTLLLNYYVRKEPIAKNSDLKENDNGVLVRIYGEDFRPKAIPEKYGNLIIVTNGYWYSEGDIQPLPYPHDALFLYKATSTLYPYDIIFEANLPELFSYLYNKQLSLVASSLLALVLATISYRLLCQFFTFMQVNKAIRTNQFIPHLQPIVDARSGKWIGAETLIRWQHPKYGLIYPGPFIELIEKKQIIVPITSQIIHNVAKALSSDHFMQRMPAEFFISFNISLQSCQDFTLLDDCKQFLAHFPPSHKVNLILELIEREDILNTSITSQLFAQLRQLGVIIAIDDFGTSNANLDYIENFRIDYLKIDGSFVNKISSSSYSRKIIDSIIDIAIKLEIMVVAEGVETEEQRDYLLSRNVFNQQGFLFSRPLSLDDFYQQIEKNS